MKNRNKFSSSVFMLILLIIATINVACTKEDQPNIQFENLRVILPPPVSGGTAAYGIIKNTGSGTDTLKSIKTNAGMATLHKTEIINGAAQMNPVDNFQLSANQPLVLKPMSYHLMLMGINHDIIKEGGNVILTFEFEKAGLIKVTAPVVSN